MTISTRAVWAAYGAVATAMVVTYARVDPSELYNVSRTGLAGGRTYYFAVTAYDNAGNESAYSAEVSKAIP